MNNKSCPIFIIVTMTALAAAAGCSDRSKTEPAPIAGSPSPAGPEALPAAPMPVAPGAPAPVSPDPFIEITAALDSVTRGTVARLSAALPAMEQAVDAQVAAWKAGGVVSTTAAEEKLAKARTDFAQSISALSMADDVTWNSVKEGAQSSLQNLRRALADYRTGQAGN